MVGLKVNLIIELEKITEVMIVSIMGALNKGLKKVFQ